MTKIDKNIPIPDNQRNKKYPFGDMSVGDSFFTDIAAPRIRSASSAYGRQSGKKFSIRVVTEDGKTGVRVWRIE